MFCVSKKRDTLAYLAYGFWIEANLKQLLYKILQQNLLNRFTFRNENNFTVDLYNGFLKFFFYMLLWYFNVKRYLLLIYQIVMNKMQFLFKINICRCIFHVLIKLQLLSDRPVFKGRLSFNIWIKEALIFQHNWSCRLFNTSIHT